MQSNNVITYPMMNLFNAIFTGVFLFGEFVYLLPDVEPLLAFDKS
jgi:hypothetical protein